MVEALVMDHNLSLLALEPATKAPLAVMLNGAFHRDEIDMPRQEVLTSIVHCYPNPLSNQSVIIEQVLDSCEDKKFHPIAAMLHEVQIRSREYFHKNNIETAFDLKVRHLVTLLFINGCLVVSLLCRSWPRTRVPEAWVWPLT